MGHHAIGKGGIGVGGKEMHLRTALGEQSRLGYRGLAIAHHHHPPSG